MFGLGNLIHDPGFLREELEPDGVNDVIFFARAGRVFDISVSDVSGTAAKIISTNANLQEITPGNWRGYCIVPSKTVRIKIDVPAGSTLKFNVNFSGADNSSVAELVVDASIGRVTSLDNLLSKQKNVVGLKIVGGVLITSMSHLVSDTDMIRYFEVDSTVNVTDFSYAFSNSDVITIPSGFTFGSATTIASMFRDCKSLENKAFTIVAKNVIDASYVFANSNVELVSRIELKKGCNYSHAFDMAGQLKCLRYINTIGHTGTTKMFNKTAVISPKPSMQNFITSSTGWEWNAQGCANGQPVPPFSGVQTLSASRYEVDQVTIRYTKISYFGFPISYHLQADAGNGFVTVANNPPTTYIHSSTVATIKYRIVSSVLDYSATSKTVTGYTRAPTGTHTIPYPVRGGGLSRFWTPRGYKQIRVYMSGGGAAGQYVSTGCNTGGNKDVYSYGGKDGETYSGTVPVTQMTHYSYQVGTGGASAGAGGSPSSIFGKATGTAGHRVSSGTRYSSWCGPWYSPSKYRTNLSIYDGQSGWTIGTEPASTTGYGGRAGGHLQSNSRTWAKGGNGAIQLSWYDSDKMT